MIRRLTADTLIYGLGPQIPRLASLFILPIITPYLTLADYGVFGIVNAYVAALSVFQFLGLRIILVNSFYRNPARHLFVWKRIYGVLSIWKYPYTLIFACIIYLTLPREAEENALLIILLNASPFLFFGPTQMMGQTYFQVTRRPVQAAWRAAAFGTLAIVLNIYTIKYLELGYLGWMWSTFVSTILMNASHWYPLRKQLKCAPVYAVTWRWARVKLKIGLPVIPHYYSSYLLRSSDRVVLDSFNVSIKEIGNYNVANSLGNYINAINTALSQALGPQLSELYKGNQFGKARYLIWFLQSLFLMGCFAISIWSKEIFVLLFRNSEFHSAYQLAIIIIMAYSYRPMYHGANSILQFYEFTNKLWRISFVAGALNVTLNIILIPKFGVLSSAVITFVTYQYLALSGYYLKEFRKENRLNYYPIGWFLVTIGATLLAYVVTELSLPVKLGITISGAFAFLLLLRQLLRFLR